MTSQSVHRNLETGRHIEAMANPGPWGGAWLSVCCCEVAQNLPSQMSVTGIEIVSKSTKAGKDEQKKVTSSFNLVAFGSPRPVRADRPGLPACGSGTSGCF